jgi:L-alanine-DL-glutamate epimerase-like enolase superfamily enzyme
VEFRELIENDWIDYARIDLGVVGGITEARKIAGWCETHYIDIAMHNPLGPVATAASLHFNLACPNMAVQEQAMTPGELGDVVGGQPTLDGGNLLPTDRPGFGLTFDRDAARRIGGSDTLTPRLHRPDGSVTNW